LTTYFTDYFKTNKIISIAAVGTSLPIVRIRDKSRYYWAYT